MRSITVRSSNVTNGMSSSRAAAALTSDVGMHTTSRSEPSANAAPIPRIAQIAVDPVPSPTVMPDRTHSTARSAAAFFWAVCGSSAADTPTA